MKKIVYIFLIVFISYSCAKNKGKENYNAPIFDNQEFLDVKVINDDFLFRSIDFICTYDSLLVVCDRSIDPVVHVFNKNNGNFIKSIGKKGKGPDELVEPRSISFDHKNKRLFIHDAGKNAIISIDMNDVISLEKPIIEEIRFNSDQHIINYSYFLRDSLFILRNGLGEIVLGTMSQTINKILITSPESIDPHDWRMFLSIYSLASINPQGDKFVLGTTIGGILYIYTTNLDVITLETTKYFYKPIFERKKSIFNFDESEFGFYNLHLSDHFIYSILFGQKKPTDLPQDICKFDYSGNPITRFNVGYPVSTITVDEKERLIYMAIYKDGELALARAVLPHYTKS